MTLSFDVFLQFSQRQPPINGEKALALLEGVVRAHGGGARAEHGYFFDTRDGIPIEMYAGEDGKGAMVALRGGAIETMRFIFDLMKATGWTAIAGDAAAALETVPLDSQHEGFPEATLVSTVEELATLLLPDFTKWSAYRDQVIQGQ